MKKQGGPAFPRPIGFHPHVGGEYSPAQMGMSMLDYFAGQALVGLLANNNLCGEAVVSAYEVAHMMLEERIKYHV
jgi:hypothetical protein